jgi:hypothetical protein
LCHALPFGGLVFRDTEVIQLWRIGGRAARPPFSSVLAGSPFTSRSGILHHVKKQSPSPMLSKQTNLGGLVLQIEIASLFRVHPDGFCLVAYGLHFIDAVGSGNGSSSRVISD